MSTQVCVGNRILLKLEALNSYKIDYSGLSRKAHNPSNPLKKMVGAEGFEPPTSCSQSRHATRLRHAPTQEKIEELKKDKGRNLSIADPPRLRQPQASPRFSASRQGSFPEHARRL